jgi:putative DNA methylase
VEAVYPIQGDAENTVNLLSGTNISYDLIHVCRKRDQVGIREKRAWATIRTEIRREARKEIERIEKGVYGNSKSLAPADKLIVLTGKCLQLYSRHYNAVVDHTGRVVPLKEALEDIRMLVDQLISQERPLPGELEDIDRPSYVYLTALSEKKEIKSDEVFKATRGIIEVDELLEAGLMKRGRAGRGRTFEVKTPTERFSTLLEKFKDASLIPQTLPFEESPIAPDDGRSLFIDRLHFLIGLAEGKENLKPWIERWRGEIPQIRAACEYLLERRKDFAPALKKILTMIDVGSLGFK